MRPVNMLQLTTTKALQHAEECLEIGLKKLKYDSTLGQTGV